MDIVGRLRIGEPCSEAGNPCKDIDAKSDCQCAIAANEIERLREKVNYLLISICEAGDLLDAGQLIDASNRLDEAKFNHNMER